MLTHHKNRTLKILALTLGTTAIISQIILLREFVTVFYGNETAYALVLGSWLFWVSAGSWVFSRLTSRIKTPGWWLSVLLIVNAFLIPASVVMVRLIKVLLDIPTGQIVGMLPMAGTAFLIPAPLTFALGGFFTLLCRYGETIGETDARRATGSIYLFESVGAGVGGLAFSFILMLLLSSMSAALLLAAFNLVVLLTVIKRRHMASYRLGFFFLLALLIFVGSGADQRFDRWTRRLQWRDLHLIEVTDSVYGNLALTQRGRDFSLFENGLLSYTTREVVDSEQSVHFGMLAHPDPRQILLIGSGIGGTLEEILKYDGARIDYVDLDPKVVEISRRHLPDAFLAPVRNPRVRSFFQDARLFVKRAGELYDVVIINLSGPYTALLNRYYTVEFFDEVKRILRPGGIMTFSVPSSENYLSPEARDFLRSLHTTAGRVFDTVKVVPGDTAVFLARKTPGGLNLDPLVLMSRLNKRGIQTKYVSADYLPFRLNEWRMRDINESLSEPGQINRDSHPIAFLYDIVLWSTHVNRGFRSLIWVFKGITVYHLFLIPVILLAGGWVLSRFYPASPVHLSILVTGFSEIVFQVIVILAFQALYGYAYYKIGLIMASFMTGLALGSWTARKIIGYPRRQVERFYKQAQGAIVVYPLILPFLFVVFQNTVSTRGLTGLLASVFAFLPVIAGFLGGIQYPLAVTLVQSLKSGRTVSASAGFLYALDVLGATFGALITGVILIPLWGINAVAFFCAALNAVVLFLLLVKRFS